MNLSDNKIIMYQTDDGVTEIDVHMEDETVCLSQAQRAELFQTSKQNVSLHISNCFKEGELYKNSVAEMLFLNEELTQLNSSAKELESKITGNLQLLVKSNG